MAIKNFTFDRSLSDPFIRFGYDHYKGDNNWIPPFKEELYQQLSPYYPFYSKKGNDHRHFLALAGNRVVGRISAMVNSDLLDKDGTAVGTIGFFECIEDYQVASDLLSTATGWLHEKLGFKRIWGPMNFDIWHSYRFMTKGYDQKVFYGEPYNKPYYPDFFERFGLLPKQVWDSIEITERSVLEKMIARGAKRHQMLLSRGYRFVAFNEHVFRKELRKLHYILTETFSGFLGFTPLSFTEFEQLFSKSRYALNPRLIVFAYDENNKLAGFALALLEVSDAIQSMNGKDNLIGKLRFLHNLRHVNRINFYAGGITSEEMTKMSGLGRAGFYCVIRQALDEGYENIMITLMAKNNKVHGLLGKNIKKTVREYTLYELNL